MQCCTYIPVEKPKPWIRQLSYFHMNLYHTVLFWIHVYLTSHDLSRVLINSFSKSKNAFLKWICSVFSDTRKLPEKALQRHRVTTLLNTSPLGSLSWYVMRDRRLFSQRMSSCAVPTHRPSLLPASMLQTLFGHLQAAWGHRTPWTLIRTLRQAGRQAGSPQSHCPGDREG